MPSPGIKPVVKPAPVVADNINKFVRNVRNKQLPGVSQLADSVLQNIARYVETRLPTDIKNKKYYVHRSESGLPCTIDYDPKTRHTFVHFKKTMHLGSGAWKDASRSLIYDPKNPRICTALVLRNTQASPENIAMFDSEIKLYKNMQKGTTHVVKTIATTEHVKRRTLRNQKVLIQENYTPLVAVTPTTHGPKNMLMIAKGLLIGLNELHKKKGIVHRDLHPGNLFVGKNNGGFIGDLGLSKQKAKVKGYFAQGIQRFTAPELLYCQKATPTMYQKGEIYSLGLNLYRLFYKRLPQWTSNLPNAQGFDSPKNKREKIKQFSHTILSEISARKHQLRSIVKKRGERHLNARQALEYTILSMVDPNPKKRKSLDHWIHRCRRALSKA